MTNRLVVSFVAVALAAAAVHAGQTTRIGMPARGGATSADVLVLQQINLATGQPYGTMPVQYVIEALPRLTGIADLAIVGWAGGSPGLSMDATSRPILATAEVTFNTLSVLGIRQRSGGTSRRRTCSPGGVSRFSRPGLGSVTSGSVSTRSARKPG